MSAALALVPPQAPGHDLNMPEVFRSASREDWVRFGCGIGLPEASLTPQELRFIDFLVDDALQEMGLLV